MISIIIPTAKTDVLTAKSLVSCPVPYELIISKVAGVGAARAAGVSAAKNDLIVMFDDDLIIKPSLWQLVLSLKRGQFILAHVGEHLSTRVFAIHRCDYDLVGGFDSKIKYIFEDGDFYLRALKNGLKCKVISTAFYFHPYHTPRTVNRWLLVRLAWEYSRLYVKYKRDLHNYPTDFFIRPLDYKVFLFHFPVKIFGIIYWYLHHSFFNYLKRYSYEN